MAPETRDVPLKNFEDEEKAEAQDKVVSVSEDEFNALAKVPNSGEATERTRYDKPINLVIDKVSVSKLEDVQTDKNNGKYILYRVNLHYSNGEVEGLGGFRAYLDDKGKPNRFWNSEKSAGGEIKKMLEGFLEVDDPMSFHQFVSNLQGMKVRVRSKDWAVGKDKGFKNLPIEFSPKE